VYEDRIEDPKREKLSNSHTQKTIRRKRIARLRRMKHTWGKADYSPALMTEFQYSVTPEYDLSFGIVAST
jgi:hypothetical protein